MRHQSLCMITLVILAGCSTVTPALSPAEAVPATIAPDPTPTGASAPADLPTAASALLPTLTPKPTQPVVAFDPAQTKLALIPLVDSLERPLFATHAGDGSRRLFIVEKPGRIRIFVDGQLLPLPFLDITDRVNSNANEQGLLGLAFAPDYQSSGLFWVNYTKAGGATVVARYQTTADPNLADSSSEFVIMQIDQPAPNHNGGMLTFGPDGALWIGTGDGGAANDRFHNGQNPATLLGKMLRLDVTSDLTQPYLIPTDNPWIDADWNGVDVRDEIWAVGLRNPWRFSFDRLTGDLWIGDVGQNQWEEVHYTPAPRAGGLNYGWPIMEANHCFNGSTCDASGLETPIFEYSHAQRCSITGGYVYRGQAYPALHGVYFYADYCSGEIWAAAPDSNGVWRSEPVLDTQLMITSFGEDEQGELYVVDDSGGVAQLIVE